MDTIQETVAITNITTRPISTGMSIPKSIVELESIPMILSPRQATWLAIVLADVMAATVLYGALRIPRAGYSRDSEPCVLVLTESGHDCR
jgi:hypothetical protein